VRPVAVYGREKSWRHHTGRHLGLATRLKCPPSIAPKITDRSQAVPRAPFLWDPQAAVSLIGRLPTGFSPVNGRRALPAFRLSSWQPEAVVSRSARSREHEPGGLHVRQGTVPSSETTAKNLTASRALKVSELL
jgi:hypothetical protein